MAPPVIFSLLIAIASSLIGITSAAGNLYNDLHITWGDGRGKILDNGQLLSLSLDKSSGSGFESKHEYLFGNIDMQLKLVPGNCAGTFTAYYLSSQGPTNDEIDFEFLWNLSGDPYTLHTNMFTEGRGNREQQFHLWFDTTLDFHTYSLLWNPLHIIFAVDRTPIRNLESRGDAFLRKQSMRIYSSLWNADDWATWARAPFTASYRSFNANACVWSSGASTCSSTTNASRSNSWLTQELDAPSQERIRWVQRNYMIYNYCTDLR